MPRTFVWHPTRGPKVTPKNEPATGGKVKITQVKSEIGHSETMRLTLRALGLRNHQSSVIQHDTPALRGQIKKVRHLVQVTPVKE
jgi:large subunit ribosomal protein L30